MKAIRTVGIIGLGALGALYANLFTKALGKENVLVLADENRIRRYREDGLLYNGEPADFNYTVAAEVETPVDLLIFASKFGGLRDSIQTCRHLIDSETTLLSVLNGISSEQILGETFSPDQVVWCIAQKMGAKKEGNRVTVFPVGELALGIPEGMDDAHFRRLIPFLDSIQFPYSLPADIRTHTWSKLLCNTGCNQANIVFQCSYQDLQVPGKPRDTMIEAMREVVLVANAEGVPLSESDVEAWVSVIDHLPPDGESSMRQDGKAHRKSEVELFAGTIRSLAQKHGIAVPVNDWLYEQILAMESTY